MQLVDKVSNGLTSLFDSTLPNYPPIRIVLENPGWKTHIMIDIKQGDAWKHTKDNSTLASTDDKAKDKLQGN